MYRPRHQHALAARQALRHQHRLGCRRRTVVHRSVSNFLTYELAHQRLKLENCLQRALRDFRLIGCVRGEKLAALDDRVRHHRAQVTVDARAKKTRVPVRVFRRALFEILNDFCFRIRSGNLQCFAQPKAFGNAGKKFVDRFCADGGEHLLPFGWALREVAHQAEASVLLAAM